MADKIKIRRGLFADLPDLDEGELGYVKDRGTVYIGTNTDNNILLNPVLVADDGYTLDGYLYPAIDNVHGLGTPNNRWQSVSIGPGSLHIISKDTDPGYSVNSDFKIGIDSSTGKLQFISNDSVVLSIDPNTGISAVSETTFQENKNAQQQINQSILQSLDGYVIVSEAITADNAGARGDGYLAFFTSTGTNIQGDNDLRYDREANRLFIAGGDPGLVVSNSGSTPDTADWSGASALIYTNLDNTGSPDTWVACAAYAETTTSDMWAGYFQSLLGTGIEGWSGGGTNPAGVRGIIKNGTTLGAGVVGLNNGGSPNFGYGTSYGGGAGVIGVSAYTAGVVGVSTGVNNPGVKGIALTPDAYGVYGIGAGTGPGGQFIGGAPEAVGVAGITPNLASPTSYIAGWRGAGVAGISGEAGRYGVGGEYANASAYGEGVEGWNAAWGPGVAGYCFADSTDPWGTVGALRNTITRGAGLLGYHGIGSNFGGTWTANTAGAAGVFGVSDLTAGVFGYGAATGTPGVVGVAGELDGYGVGGFGNGSGAGGKFIGGGTGPGVYAETTPGDVPAIYAKTYNGSVETPQQWFGAASVGLADTTDGIAWTAVAGKIYGTAYDAIGVYGEAISGQGVYGISRGGIDNIGTFGGLRVDITHGAGVLGVNNEAIITAISSYAYGAGVVGGSTNQAGVVGIGAATGIPGVVGIAGELDGYGVGAYGNGSGAGLLAVGGGVAGSGVQGTGGVDGAGIRGIGTGIGVGLWATGGATGGGAFIEGVGTNTYGLSAASTGNAHAVYGYAPGSGAGVYGDTSDGTGYAVVANADVTTPTRSALRIIPQDTDPSSASMGDIYVNSSTGALKAHDGSSWKNTATVSNTASTGDGYIAFFTSTGGVIAGDNDLYYDRVNSRLGINTTPYGGFHMLSQATDTTPTAFTTDDFIIGGIGPDGGTNTGSLFFRYNKTQEAGFIGSLSPGVTWRTMFFGAHHTVFQNSAGGTAISFDGANNLNAIRVRSDGSLFWSQSTDAADTPDTGISRTAAGTLAVGNGTQGDASGTLKVASIQVAGDIVNKDLSETFQTIRTALDGYGASATTATSTDSAARGDGYLAFFTDTGTNIQGDNDLWWDRQNNRLGIHNTAPTVELDIVGSVNVVGTAGFGLTAGTFLGDTVGNGITTTGGSSGGDGISATGGGGNSIGVRALGTGVFPGVFSTGGSGGGHGVQGTGGATDGYGGRFAGGQTNGQGLLATGTGEGAGGVFFGGSTGYGLVIDNSAVATRSAFRIVPQASAPTIGFTGDLYVNNNDGKLYICTVKGYPGSTPPVWTVVGTQA